MTVYHISRKYLGKHPVLEPRIPISAPDTEKAVERVCVAPTVSGCYLSCEDEFDFFQGAPPFHVYSAEVENAQPAHASVADKRRTGELWLTEATRFNHVGKMPRLKLRDVPYKQCAWRTRKIRDWVEGTFGWMTWSAK